MKTDLADKQRLFQAAKTERSKVESEVWESDDYLKVEHMGHLKTESKLNEIRREHDQRLEDLHYNNQEIEKQE